VVRHYKTFKTKAEKMMWNKRTSPNQ